jgi:hypothetical protein
MRAAYIAVHRRMNRSGSRAGHLTDHSLTFKLSAKMHGAGSNDTKAWDEDDDLAPDSTVRPTGERPEAIAITLGSSARAIGTIRPTARTIRVTVSVALSPLLLGQCGPGGWYVTLQRMDGGVLHEGPLDELGFIDATVTVPQGTRAVKVHIESATKYKDAIIAVRDDGFAEHTFA